MSDKKFYTQKQATRGIRFTTLFLRTLPWHRTVGLMGPPGVAKTASVEQYAQKVGARVMYWMAANKQPFQAQGLPGLMKRGSAQYTTIFPPEDLFELTQEYVEMRRKEGLDAVELPMEFIENVKDAVVNMGTGVAPDGQEVPPTKEEVARQIMGLYAQTEEYLKRMQEQNPNYEPDKTILFLDEMTNATPEMMAVLQKITHERMIGDRYKMHEGVRVMFAGNRTEDSIAVNEMPLPLRTRVSVVNFCVEIEEFQQYALKQGMRPSVIAMAGLRPDLWCNVDKAGESGAYMCPRTLTDASENLDGVYAEMEQLRREGVDERMIEELFVEACVSQIGPGIGHELAYLELSAAKVPSPAQVYENPKEAAVLNDEPGLQSMVNFGLLADLIKTAEQGASKELSKKVDSSILYFGRLDPGFREYAMTTFFGEVAQVPDDLMIAAMESENFDILKEGLKEEQDVYEESKATRSGTQQGSLFG